MDIYEEDTKMCDFMTSDFDHFQYSPLFNDHLTPFEELSDSLDGSPLSQCLELNLDPLTPGGRVDGDARPVDARPVDAANYWEEHLCDIDMRQTNTMTGLMDLSRVQEEEQDVDDDEGGDEVAGVRRPQRRRRRHQQLCAGTGEEELEDVDGGLDDTKMDVDRVYSKNSSIVLNDHMISAQPVSPRKVVVKREHSYSTRQNNLKKQFSLQAGLRKSPAPPLSPHRQTAAPPSASSVCRRRVMKLATPTSSASSVPFSDSPNKSRAYRSSDFSTGASVVSISGANCPLTSATLSASSSSSSALSVSTARASSVVKASHSPDLENDYVDILGDPISPSETQVFTIKTEPLSVAHESEIDILTVAANHAQVQYETDIGVLQAEDYLTTADNMPLTPPGSSCSTCSDDTLSSSEVACSNNHHHRHPHHPHHQHQHHPLHPTSSATSGADLTSQTSGHVTYSARNFNSQISGTAYVPGSGIGGTTSNGILLLTEEERRTLILEGYPVPACKSPLSKHDERNLKKVRRKIKNKISAQESRRKKKEYLETLEKRLEIYNRDNTDLKKQVLQLQSNNSSLTSQLNKLQNLVSKFTTKAAPQSSTCLAAVVLSFALFLGAWSPLYTAVAPSVSSIGEDPLSHTGSGIQYNARNVNRAHPAMAQTYHDVRSRVLIADYNPSPDSLDSFPHPQHHQHHNQHQHPQTSLPSLMHNIRRWFNLSRDPLAPTASTNQKRDSAPNANDVDGVSGGDMPTRETNSETNTAYILNPSQ